MPLPCVSHLGQNLLLLTQRYQFCGSSNTFAESIWNLSTLFIARYPILVIVWRKKEFLAVCMQYSKAIYDLTISRQPAPTQLIMVRKNSQLLSFAPECLPFENEIYYFRCERGLTRILSKPQQQSKWLKCTRNKQSFSRSRRKAKLMLERTTDFSKAIYDSPDLLSILLMVKAWCCFNWKHSPFAKNYSYWKNMLCILHLL